MKENLLISTVFLSLTTTGLFFSCGQSAEEKKKIEKAKQDSIQVEIDKKAQLKFEQMKREEDSLKAISLIKSDTVEKIYKSEHSFDTYINNHNQGEGREPKEQLDTVPSNNVMCIVWSADKKTLRMKTMNKESNRPPEIIYKLGEVTEKVKYKDYIMTTYKVYQNNLSFSKVKVNNYFAIQKDNKMNPFQTTFEFISDNSGNMGTSYFLYANKITRDDILALQQDNNKTESKIDKPNTQKNKQELPDDIINDFGLHFARACDRDQYVFALAYRACKNAGYSQIYDVKDQVSKTFTDKESRELFFKEFFRQYPVKEKMIYALSIGINMNVDNAKKLTDYIFKKYGNQ